MLPPFLPSAELDPALTYNADRTRGQCVHIICGAYQDMGQIPDCVIIILSMNDSIFRGHHLPVEEPFLFEHLY